MIFLAELWLPILLSAVFVFIVSSLVHVVLHFHDADHSKLPDEDGVLEALRNHGVGSGSFVFPHGECNEMNTPEMKAKLEKGPVGFMTVLGPGGFNMGRSLLHWFLFCLLVGIFIAYISRLALSPGVEYLRVFRVVGATAFLGYGISELQASIWKGQSCKSSMKFVFDGLLYALVTAGTFAWLWPQA